MSPNFAPLDLSQPEVAILVGAMVQARDAVERRVVVASARADKRRMVGRCPCRSARAEARAPCEQSAA